MTDEATHGLEALVPEGARAERVATGASWSEGPLWLPARGVLIWSDIHGNRIMQYSPSTGETGIYRSEVEFTNGRTLDLDGSIVQCSHGRRRVERDVDGEISLIVDHFTDESGTYRFNSPNDVVVASDGSIWFTDPPYGITFPEEGHPGEREYGGCWVFRHDPATGETIPVVTDMEEPNGLAFSPDEGVLYIADTSAASVGFESGNHHIRAYDIVDGKAVNGRLFADIARGIADGFRVDEHGNIWTSSLDAIIVYAPDGSELGSIPVPEKSANVCFGGTDGTELFIAASTSIYWLPTLTRDAARH
ncbi:SMP-30/gluconolactonase/LRE family protein [Gryllotalpicola reticulitermitis]|uniref:SMP-30/gluconolactonase/LRE family protein n=1 Tax=Gryllotalpicola reticulitermitis TaxID=1184153 RepID=A0ABV8Q6T0_9MICO